MATKLYVGNLPFDTTEDGLKTLFQAEGRQVEEVTLIMDRDSGRPRGFGFVQMATPEDAAAAIKSLNGHDLGGRQLTVSEARSRDERGGDRQQGSRGGRGGFGGRERF